MIAILGTFFFFAATHSPFNAFDHLLEAIDECISELIQHGCGILIV
jgi:hypothetical protein